VHVDRELERILEEKFPREESDKWYRPIQKALIDSFLDDFQINDGPIYIGVSLDKIKDDETGLQFKQRVQAEIEKIVGEEVKCSYHEDAGYDG
jgi:hypothetical protein